MLKKVLEYAGDYRKKTYQAIATMLIGVGMNILPYLSNYYTFNHASANKHSLYYF